MPAVQPRFAYGHDPAFRAYMQLWERHGQIVRILGELLAEAQKLERARQDLELQLEEVRPGIAYGHFQYLPLYQQPKA